MNGIPGKLSWRMLAYPVYFAGMFGYRYFLDDGRHDVIKSLLFASISTALYVAMMMAVRRGRRAETDRVRLLAGKQ